MTFTYRPAERSKAIPLVGLYGPSGSGKTYSALLLARGMVDKGNVILIDTESGRGQVYADVIPGGYNVIDLGEPFSPERYVDAIKFAEESADIIVVDSASHEWEGAGGVLDQAAANEERTGKTGLHCWIKPKAAHKKFMLKLLGCRCPVIVCLRAKHKSRQVKNNGKTEIVRDEHASAIQDESFIYEMMVHAELNPDHTLIVSKVSHPALSDVFRNGEVLSLDHGRRLAEWCAGAEKGEIDVLARRAASRGLDSYRTFFAGLGVKDKRALVEIGIHDEIKASFEESSPPEEDAGPPLPALPAGNGSGAYEPLSAEPEPETPRRGSGSAHQWVYDLRRQLQCDTSLAQCEETWEAFDVRYRDGTAAARKEADKVFSERIQELRR